MPNAALYFINDNLFILKPFLTQKRLTIIA